MTMQEQELTLFGGWARAQIPPPIESGVEKISVTLSVSIYVRDSFDEEEYTSYTSKDSKVLYYPSLYTPIVDAYRANTRLMYDEWAKLRTEEYNEVMNPYKKWTRREYGDQGQYVEYVATIWTGVFLRTWLDKSFLRFFGIWERGTHATIIRGLAGTKKLGRSISGMIGGNYNSGFADDKKPITKLPSGEYTLSDVRTLYKDIPRLPKEGIANARKLARQLREQRINKNL